MKAEIPLDAGGGGASPEEADLLEAPTPRIPVESAGGTRTERGMESLGCARHPSVQSRSRARHIPHGTAERLSGVEGIRIAALRTALTLRRNPSSANLAIRPRGLPALGALESTLRNAGVARWTLHQSGLRLLRSGSFHVGSRSRHRRWLGRSGRAGRCRRLRGLLGSLVLLRWAPTPREGEPRSVRDGSSRIWAPLGAVLVENGKPARAGVRSGGDKVATVLTLSGIHVSPS